MNVDVILETVASRLGAGDDPTFWLALVRSLTADLEAAVGQLGNRDLLYLRIGACSHWLRPHQTRLAAAGGFALPVGYGGGAYSRSGAPEFDWSALFEWNAASQTWAAVARERGKQKVVCRVAAPTRTARHAQAAVNVSWTPTSRDGESRSSYLGFRKREGVWECVATGCLTPSPAA